MAALCSPGYPYIRLSYCGVPSADKLIAFYQIKESENWAIVKTIS